MFRILIMRSVGNRDDLTTKARIRDAALSLFPQHGFAATTIRQLAGEAGVSPGLVVHHFGSKDGLREECDRHVVALFRQTKLQAMEDGNLYNPAFTSAAYEVAPQIMRYLGWSLARSHPAADALYDEMLRETIEVSRVAIDRGLIVDSPNLELRTAAQLTMQLGLSVLHAHFERATGIDPLTSKGIGELTPILLEIFGGLFTAEVLEKMHEALAEGSAASTGGSTGSLDSGT